MKGECIFTKFKFFTKPNFPVSLNIIDTVGSVFFIDKKAVANMKNC